MPLLTRQVWIAGEPSRQFAGAVSRGEQLGDRAHLRPVVRRAVIAADLAPPPGRPDFGKNDLRVIGQAEASLERPDARALGPAWIVAQCPHDRNTGQRL